MSELRAAPKPDEKTKAKRVDTIETLGSARIRVQAASPRIPGLTMILQHSVKMRGGRGNSENGFIAACALGKFAAAETGHFA